MQISVTFLENVTSFEIDNWQQQYKCTEPVFVCGLLQEKPFRPYPSQCHILPTTFIAGYEYS